MTKEIHAADAPSEQQRATLNVGKIQAAFCIALSAAVSVIVIGWLLA